MATLNKDEIRRHFEKGELISNPRLTEQKEFDIEPASYDLTAGTVIWKQAEEVDSIIVIVFPRQRRKECLSLR